MSIWGLLALYFYLRVVNSYAQINDGSEEFIRLVRKAWATGYLASSYGKGVDRELRCMRGLRIQASEAFYYDKGMVLTVVETVLLESVNLLIAY